MNFLKRNYAPLLVSLASIAVIVAAVAVTVDRLGDDDDGGRRIALDFDGRGRFALDDLVTPRLQPEDAFGPLRDALRDAPRGTVLGVSIDDTDGSLLVTAVQPGSPAAGAGVETGDEIVSVDGDAVATLDELRERLAAVERGTEYELALTRDGEALTLDVERPALVLDGSRFQFATGRAQLGVTVEETDHGPRVVSVTPGSAAAEAGIEIGDLIASIDGESVHDIAQLRELVAAHAAGDSVEVGVDRDGESLTLEASLQSGGFFRFGDGDRERFRFAPRRGTSGPST